MRILLTGAAGFIAFHTSLRLLNDGHEVIGVDNLNDYYDVNLKQARLEQLLNHNSFKFEKINIADKELVQAVFKQYQPQRVINLAAQAGVRYSLDNPHAYIESNIQGFTNILEGARHHNVEHLVFASTSSVYGANSKQPFSEHDSTDHPLALYAASKKANELMAHSYAHLFRLPCTGLRFFTVYGPWGRPDMALFKFTKNILENKPIDVYNNGEMIRDFTYVDDIVEGIVRVVAKPAEPDPNWDSNNPDPASSNAPYRVYNIGNNAPVNLMDYIGALEKHLGKVAEKNYMPMQDGDVPSTYADASSLERDFGYKPATSVEDGVARFVEWYLEFYYK